MAENKDFKKLLELYDFFVGCEKCCQMESRTTCSIVSFHHSCSRSILVAKPKVGSFKWSRIYPPPSFPKPKRYAVCKYFDSSKGCEGHGSQCAYAKCQVEASVWNLLKETDLCYSTLLKLSTGRALVSQQLVQVNQSIKKTILQMFPGLFVQLCGKCFHSTPQKITVKGNTSACKSEHRHLWEPILVLQRSCGQYEKVRPRPQSNGAQPSTYRYCEYVLRKEPCQHGDHRCRFAHNDVEMAVWNFESNEGFDRSVLPSAHKPPLKAAASSSQWYDCQPCGQRFDSRGCLMNHCNTLQHSLRLHEVNSKTREWKYRDPPPTSRSYKLCERPSTCVLGSRCVDAHSEDELQEWHKRDKESKKKKTTAGEQGLISYQDDLLREYRDNVNKALIMSEAVAGVTVTCDQELVVSSIKDNEPFKWLFHVQSERPLVAVALLKKEQGAFFSLGEISSEVSYSSGKMFHQKDLTYEIPVSFKPINLGIYEQWLVLDFDTRPVLLLKVKVTNPQGEELLELPENDRHPSQNMKRWHQENRVIISCLDRADEQKELLKEYKPPQSLGLKLLHASHTPLSHQNYKDHMHNFLYNEELAEDLIISRLNFSGTIKLSDILENQEFGMKFAPKGQLFCSIAVPYSLTPDTPEGLTLRRSVQSALIAPASSTQPGSRVYEAIILRDTTSKDHMHLQLTEECCTELNLKRNENVVVEVQFMLNRLKFCEMHKAVDLLPDTQRVLPDLKHHCGIVSKKEYPGLNLKQQAAMDLILADTECKSPLLIYGPFGTGKTLTLATAARELALQPQSKVLICTLTNSSADLYVRCHFHDHVNSNHPEVRPLRIKSEEASLISTDEITLNYCHLSRDKTLFCFPEKDTVDMYKVVITTTSMARHFHQLTLPPGYFTHILVDEASQMLECEALMPLGLAGPNTRVILAGDHMQMGPKLFSVDDHHRANHTLLNRLFHFYQQQKGDAALRSRIIFSENYRSTKEIVDFVSTHFYVGKTDVIKAVGNVPSYPDGKALKFHHVRGECVLHTFSMSWYNLEEVTSVVDIVQSLLEHWPAEWEVKDPSLICVLSEGCQVSLIRRALRSKHLNRVTVENMANVQGKQFRAIVMTAIHTRDSLHSSDSPCLEFFNDACVLNTAMTRAQSQVIVVGDAAALCYFGKCSRIWKSYVHHCFSKGSVLPQTLTEDYLEQEVRDFSRFIQDDKEDNSDSESSSSDILDIEDPILKELLDETKNVQVDVTAEGLLDIIQVDHADNKPTQGGFPTTTTNHEGSQINFQLPMHANASDQQLCTLIMERYDFGYAVPLNNPSIRIEIRGRKNIGRAFPGDHVLVETWNTEGHPNGQVVTVCKENSANKVFVCTIDKYDCQVMTPINNCITKIYTPFCKYKPKHIAVHGHEDLKIKNFVRINEETKQNQLFVVRVLKWRETFRYPLGVVVEVLPKVKSLDDGLHVLDVEYQLQRVLPESLEKEINSLKNMHTNVRNPEDYRDITTFTIDPANSMDLDDAISVRDLGNLYEIGVHIADVASCVTKDSAIDKFAHNNGTSFYPPGKEPFYMFPKDLSTNYFSLLPDSERDAISLIVEIEKNTNLIKSSKFQLTVIRSDRKLSYEETECIIQNSDGRSEEFETVEGCVVIAHHFSEVHRKARKQEDWCYKTLDDDVAIGQRRSHMLVEELMVMYNHAVTVLLLSDERSECFTPVRCQDKPRTDRFCQLREKFGALIPLSTHFTYISNLIDPIDSDPIDSDWKENVMNPNRHNVLSGRRLFTETEKTTNSTKIQAVKCPETFSILSTIMQCLQSGLRNKDIHKIVDLLTTDDIHPQLQPLMCEFRRCIRKAHVLRSKSSHLSRVGHFDLQLDSYTWASSPIRRYSDVIVQRLLHAVLRETAVGYTQCDIDLACISFSQKVENQSVYERQARCLSLASELKNQKARKVSFVIDVSPKGNSLRLSFPLNKQSMPNKIQIMYRDLQLTAQPDYNELGHSVDLKWFRRVYSFTNEHIHDHLQQIGPDPLVTAVPTDQWHDMMSAIKGECWDSMLQTLQIICSSSTEDLQKIPNHRMSRDTSQNVRANPDLDHYIELSMKVTMGDILDVQLGSETHRGLLVPDVQMLIVRDKFEICLQHSKDSTLCFSKYAIHPSKTSYSTYMEYQKIWKPLCEMESASNAVAENDSIVIEDVLLTWTKKEAHLSGVFQLPLEKKKLWAIECDLRYCFLCIRMRDTGHSSQANSAHSAINARGNIGLMDVPCVIWVAHGITTKVSGDEEETYVQIDFWINHNDTIPDRVFLKDTRFTVELIPKLLPDVRKEEAINSLTKANKLVKDVAVYNSGLFNTASSATKRKQATFQIDPPPIGFPILNSSQAKAVGDALVNTFTLIQGPPGTGKTVVGVHIVYWFFMQNQNAPKLKSEDDDGPPKKRCILYCGPSNKSVDVVAAQLVKLKKLLKPLRVYSEQMEMLEFPYPGSILKLSRRSVREEKPNGELRSITLHHLIRKPENPFSTQIVSYDARIRRRDAVSEEEIEEYKSLLRKARRFELGRYDVILCTCTASSNPNFSKLDIQQIIIDECAMATEPEAFIPLVTHKPEKIVLLGDHKQLQPIVHGDLVARLGMKTSLFERYMDKALMLDTQYRMHELICEFPSIEFYKGALKTGVKRKASVLLDRSSCPTPILFGHVEGREISLVVSTERGNENSMANTEEAEQSVRIASLLIQNAGVEGKDVAILTPYNAQVAQINETLAKRGLSNICVSTITKSQGSEWRYVILSMVRSCPQSDIDTHPTRAWLVKRLGFIMDPNQVNVGITRAQEGLCILGNKELLWCSSLWRKLLTHYQNYVVDPACNIQVKQSTVRPKSKSKAPFRFSTFHCKDI